jgi:hypothetical protein
MLIRNRVRGLDHLDARLCAQRPIGVLVLGHDQRLAAGKALQRSAAHAGRRLADRDNQIGQKRAIRVERIQYRLAARYRRDGGIPDLSQFLLARF